MARLHWHMHWTLALHAPARKGWGIMDKTLALTADYLNQRKQFGVAIGSFQALRHRVADMKMQLELARSMSYYASLKLNSPAPERHLAMARAKVQLGQSMRFVGQQAVQLHGGIGVTDDYIVSHYFKALTQLEMSFGDTHHPPGRGVSAHAGHGGGLCLIFWHTKKKPPLGGFFIGTLSAGLHASSAPSGTPSGPPGCGGCAG
jgi:hypothetical protein